ncbi:hypothetical protein GCL60_01490 [Silvanigrella paludirubra]|uniref:Uncharacterized protein n=1 Tax=Silvanigrella paludirubra TaxID=2499159 RepID=A0A6N6VWD2_9BACT|nr:hypothetical protein [Silvanigrella paludirubra]KAB8040621.1 hypothetical protein GCL60_01490 [Silvanigrella paludirubra]
MFKQILIYFELLLLTIFFPQFSLADEVLDSQVCSFAKEIKLQNEDRELQQWKVENTSLPVLTYTHEILPVYLGGTIFQNNNERFNIYTLPYYFNLGYANFITDNLGLLKISKQNFGVWYLLPSSDLVVQGSSEKNNYAKYAKLNFGSVRIKTFKINYNHDFKKNSIVLETNEIRILIEPGSDIYIERENKENKFYTKIILFCGNVKVIKNQINLNPGIEYTIYKNSYLNYQRKPDSSKIENIYALTTLPIIFENLSRNIDYKNNKNLFDIILNIGYSNIRIFETTYTGYNAKISILIPLLDLYNSVKYVLGVNTRLEETKRNSLIGNYKLESKLNSLEFGIENGLKYKPVTEFTGFILSSFNYSPLTMYSNNYSISGISINNNPKVNKNMNLGITLIGIYNIFDNFGLGGSIYSAIGYLDYSEDNSNGYNFTGNSGLYFIYNFDLSIYYLF